MFKPSVTLSNLPAELYRRLHEAAKRHDRDIDEEIVARLEQSLGEGGVRFGVLKGKLGRAPDFSEAMSDEELADWEAGDPRS